MDGKQILAYHGVGTWSVDQYNRVDFGSNPQIVNIIFYDWFTQNATATYEKEYRVKANSLISIADTIREKLNTDKKYDLTEMISGINEVYTTGYDRGKEDGGVELPTLTNEGASGDLLSGKQLIDQEGNVVTGAMTNNGAVSKTLNTNTTSYTIPQGYHSGSGEVSITTETKSVTPTKNVQTVVPTDGKVLSSVNVAAIPNQYITTTDATAGAEEIMNGETAYVNGSKITGIFTIDNELTAQDDLIAQIQSALEGKASGGGSGSDGTNIETCTVEVTFHEEYDTSDYVNVYYSKISNNKLEYQTGRLTSPITLTDVVKNSIIIFMGSNYDNTLYENSNGVTTIHNYGTGGYNLCLVTGDGAVLVRPFFIEDDFS